MLAVPRHRLPHHDLLHLNTDQELAAPLNARPGAATGGREAELLGGGDRRLHVGGVPRAMTTDAGRPTGPGSGLIAQREDPHPGEGHHLAEGHHHRETGSGDLPLKHRGGE